MDGLAVTFVVTAIVLETQDRKQLWFCLVRDDGEGRAMPNAGWVRANELPAEVEVVTFPI
jgi:hypothetical protein